MTASNHLTPRQPAGAELVALDSVELQELPEGSYVLDPWQSTFGFTLSHGGLSRFRGQFERVDARLENGVLTGSVRVESVRTPISELRQHLLGPEFFDAAASPTIDFRSTAIRIDEYDIAELDGELTIKGITRPVTARGSAAIGENFTGADAVGFDLEASIDRRDYGLSWQAKLPNGHDALGWEVTLDVHLELVEETQPAVA
jgi:polyisoprenoid-binding protein YceI